MRQTRILLAGMPTLMADMIRKMLSFHSDLQVVAEAGPNEDLRSAVQRNRADVLIIGLPTNDAVAPMTAFSWQPTKILAVSDGGERGTLWVLRPDGTPIGELSAESLIGAARLAGPV